MMRRSLFFVVCALLQLQPMCATMDCPPEPTMHGAMMNPGSISSTGNTDSIKEVGSTTGDVSTHYPNGFVPYNNDNLPDPNQGNPTPTQRKYMNTWAIVGIAISGAFFLLFVCIFAFLFLKGRRLHNNNSPTRGPKSFVLRPTPLPQVKQPNLFAKAAGMFSRRQTYQPAGGASPSRGIDMVDNERMGSYANLNQPDTPGYFDERLLAPSPPPTPPATYGWAGQHGSGDVGADTSYRSSHDDTPLPLRPGMHHGSTSESEGFLGSSTDGKGEKAKFKGQRTSWDETYQTMPSFDPDDEGRGRYDPDSRSGF